MVYTDIKKMRVITHQKMAEHVEPPLRFCYTKVTLTTVLAWFGGYPDSLGSIRLLASLDVGPCCTFGEH
jgi:hypothetical protein